MIEPNREIDELIAEHVFGYHLDYEFEDINGAPAAKELRDVHDEWGLLPHYTTDMSDAWLVVLQLATRGIWLYELAGRWETSYRVVFETRDPTRGLIFFQAMADTASQAICLAALSAVGYPVS